MRPVIILFARAPVPGRVKTRLIPPLSPASAAALHDAFVRDMLDSLVSLTGAAIELHTDSDTLAWRDIPVTRRVQNEGDLALRIFKALSSGLDRGHSRALILGSDSPTLPSGHIEALLQLDVDVALGPADDGGYYAIAARRVHAGMFDGVRWSTPYALHDTIRACEACGLTTSLGPAWFDVDDPATLERLHQSRSVPRHTADVLRSIGVQAP